MITSSTQRFFGLLLLLSVALMLLLIRPLATPLLLAAVLAGVLWPVQKRLTRAVRGRRQVSAGLLVSATLLVLVGPVAGLSAFAVNEAAQGAAFVSKTLRGGDVDEPLHHLPAPIERGVRSALETLERHGGKDPGELLRDTLNEQATRLAAAVGGALAATWSVLFNSAMLLIALFFLLTQGAELVGWLDEVLPLQPGQTHELLAEFKKTSYAIVVSTLVTAAAQSAVALVGYLIARVPHPVFFAALTFFGAFIPALGAASVTLLAAGLLLVIGHPYFALFLAIWAIAVVGFVDNIIKPLVMRGGMNMPGALVFFALIGGIAAFGPVGLVVGPLSLAFFLALLRMQRRSRAGG